MLKMGWLVVTQCHWNSAIRQSAYEFLLAFNSDCVPMLPCFSDIARYYSKIADCNLPHFCLAPPFGMTLLKFRRHFWHQRTKSSLAVIWCYLHHIASLVQYWHVTDRWTDGWTYDNNIYCTSIWLHGKNGLNSAHRINSSEMLLVKV